jgi:excinuclease ABC subunit A
LQAVGLGYLTLGQSTSTLSGGELQRLKLAEFLKDTKAAKTLFIFDEPTTGLHLHDVQLIVQIFQRLITNGHSVWVIEHHLDVIKCADWVIDLGPEGGDRGGQVVAQGTPEDLANQPTSVTGHYLRSRLSVLSAK